MMSFWVVPASEARTCSRSASRELGERPACSSATTWCSASSHIAVALIVMDVFSPATGIPSKSRRISPRCGIGTPTLPTSPRASGWSGS